MSPADFWNLTASAREAIIREHNKQARAANR